MLRAIMGSYELTSGQHLYRRGWVVKNAEAHFLRHMLPVPRQIRVTNTCG